MLTDGIQTLLQEAGESGCYFFCLVHVAERFLQKSIDVVELMNKGIEKGAVLYNKHDANDNDNFFIQNPELLLKLATGAKWTVRYESKDYKADVHEFVINRWERKATGKTYAHFDTSDFHPIAINHCNTILYGAIVSTRVCKIEL